jgi:hypothetical protein
MMHIANTYEWESDKLTEIENATTKEELKAIELKHPLQVSTDERLN